jgi:transcriptional regulator with XRE-family HTH domain
VILDLRLIGITQKRFAQECGYTEAYMSQVLRGKKDTPQARERIVETIDRLKRKAVTTTE